MDSKKQEIPGREERARLSAPEEMYVRYREIKKKKFNKWYSIYLATTVSVVIIVSLLLLFGTGNEGGRRTEGVASALLSIDFMNISGEPGSKSVIVDGEKKKIFDIISGILIPPEHKGDPSPGNNGNGKLTKEKLYEFDYSKVPEGEIPIVPMNLSLSAYGPAYIFNTSKYNPNLVEMRL